MPFTDSIRGFVAVAVMVRLRAKRKRRPGRGRVRRLSCAYWASLAQSRLAIFFSAAYFSADALIIGLMIELSAWMISLPSTQCLPSQVWIFACASPEWFTQLVEI